MKNADRPASAFVDNRSNSYEDNEVHYGLSKRELFAKDFATSMAYQYSIGDKSKDELCAEAIELADELLKQLGE